jgi:hypothetical protein
MGKKTSKNGGMGGGGLPDKNEGGEDDKIKINPG